MPPLGCDRQQAKILYEEMGLKEDSKGLGAPVAREDAAAAGTEEGPARAGRDDKVSSTGRESELHRPGQGGRTVRGEGAVP